MKKSYRINNPFRIDEKINQEITVGNKLQLDYSHCDWISVDTEFLSLNRMLDSLCVIQIASIDKDDDKKIRIEILHVFDQKADPNLKKLFTNKNIKKIFHNFQTDYPRIEEYIESEIKGDIFDTYFAAKLLLTNLKEYSLESLVNYLVDPKFSKNKRTTISEWDLDPNKWEDEQFEYAANDVVYLQILMEKLITIAKRRNREDILYSAMKILPDLALLIKNGYDLSTILI